MLVDRFLATLDIGVTDFVICDVRAGWELTFEASKAASLHYCLKGEGVMTVGGVVSSDLQPHKFILIPPSVDHGFYSKSSLDVRKISRHTMSATAYRESVPIIQVGEGDFGVEVACGEINITSPMSTDLFAGLREPLVEQFNGQDGLRDQFIMLLAESASPRFGTRTLIEALLRQCFVVLLRRLLERGTAPVPWIAGLADSRLSRALEAVFDNTAAPYTVEALAQIAGMSRSVFAARFTETFGQPPMTMVNNIRLGRARDLLLSTKMPISAIARKVGFSSRSNFSNSFQNRYGERPTQIRKYPEDIHRRGS